MDDGESLLRSDCRWRRAGGETEETNHFAAGAISSTAGPREGTMIVDAHGLRGGGGGLFGCNVCLEMAKDPVVTDCGHLFCWPCLYQWICRNSSCRECPVCKSPVDIEPGGATVTPIYGCSEAGNTGGDPELPCRPRGRQSRRSLVGAGIMELVEEISQRAGTTIHRAQMPLINRTRGTMDRLRANLSSMEGIVWEDFLYTPEDGSNVAGVLFGRVTLAPRGRNVAVDRGPRRRGGDYNPRSRSEGDDGVYRNTRRRRLEREPE